MEPTNPTEAILQFKVGEKSSENAYKFLLLETKKLPDHTGQGFRNWLASYEKEYMDKYLPEAVKWRGKTYDTAALAVMEGADTKDITYNRKKNGDYKYRTFLPAAYTSAKSVICNALDNGVSLFDSNGDPRGKSALSSAIKSVSSEKVLDSYNSCKKYVAKIKQFSAMLTPDELDDIRRKMAEI